MPYGTIVADSKNYEARSPGTYALSTLAFGDALNEFRVKGANKSKDQLLRASVTRVLEKDVTVGTGVLRKQAVVSLAIASPSSDFTSSEIDSLTADISTFLTPTVVTRLMSGES